MVVAVVVVVVVVVLLLNGTKLAMVVWYCYEHTNASLGAQTHLHTLKFSYKKKVINCIPAVTFVRMCSTGRCSAVRWGSHLCCRAYSVTPSCIAGSIVLFGP